MNKTILNLYIATQKLYTKQLTLSEIKQRQALRALQMRNIK